MYFWELHITCKASPFLVSLVSSSRRPSATSEVLKHRVQESFPPAAYREQARRFVDFKPLSRPPAFLQPKVREAKV